MGVPVVVLLATSVVSADHTVLDGCENRAKVVGNVAAGQQVEIRFAIQGELGACYKIASQDGKVKGYVPATAVASGEFEAGRRAAGTIDSASQPAPRPLPKAVPASRGIPLADAVEAKRAQDLIASGQPAQALAILDRLVAANGGNPDLLALAGLAAYKADRVKEAAQYLAASLAAHDDPRVRALLDQVRQESAGDRSTEQLTGIRFQFRYDTKEVTPANARALVQVLDSEFTRVAEQLGCRAEERITAVIQSREAYLRTTGAAEWSAGLYDGRIRVAMLEPTPGTETRRAFSHEIVHACLARTGQWPAWLHEGLAQYLSGDRPGAAERGIVREMARARALPALEQMSGGWSRLSAQHAQAAYAAALVAADQMYARLGVAGVRSLLQSPERLGQVSRQVDGWMQE
ncbi:MAG: tetratricopeptide repeat protein [Bryobacteraceae bacterium]